MAPTTEDLARELEAFALDIYASKGPETNAILRAAAARLRELEVSNAAFGLALDGWLPIESAKEGALVLLYMSLRSTGEPLGYEIGWLEDGDWMLSSKNNEPSDSVRPTHWRPLPPPPGDA